ncbi:hypothetical protein ACWCPD_16320 [Streptomyces sp. NPDC001935]
MSAPKFPDFVPREHCKSFVEQIGLAPKDVRRLEVVAEGIWATLYARDAEGRRYAVGEDVACHRVFMPFDPQIGDR